MGITFRENQMAKDAQIALPFDSTKLLDEREAAAFLNISRKTLATWRSERRYSLAYVRIGRAIRYEPAALLAFIERRRVKPKPRVRAISVRKTPHVNLQKTA